MTDCQTKNVLSKAQWMYELYVQPIKLELSSFQNGFENIY